MTKKEIQKRILQNGKPLALSKFSWDEKTRTVSSVEDDLVFDFYSIDSSTIDAGYYSTIKAGDYSTIKAGDYSTIKAGDSSTIDAGDSSTIKAGYSSTIDAGDSSTIKAGDSSTIKAGYSSTIDAGDSSTIKAGGSEIVIVNRNVFESILPDNGDKIQIFPWRIKGHLKNGLLDGVPHILADGILSKIIKQKGDVYHVINHGQTEKSYIVKKGDIYSHGTTLKKARESLIYKISDRDKIQYESLTVDSILTFQECISMYRVITGACESGTKYFVDSIGKVKKKYSIQEIIDLTKGQYGNQELVNFIGGKK